VEDVVHDEHLDRDHWWFRARRSIFGRVLDQRVALPANAVILDLGPGSGVNLELLEGRGRLVTLDLSQRSLTTCRELGSPDLVQGDATRLPFGDGTVDLVCALDVLEHLEADERALAEIARVLKPEGHLLLSVAGLEWEHRTFFNTWLFPPILAVRLAMRPLLSRGEQGGSDLGLRLPRFVEQSLFRIFASEGAWVVRRRLPIGVSLLGLAKPRR
jgi:SAM-dependent methyltransferase